MYLRIQIEKKSRFRCVRRKFAFNTNTLVGSPGGEIQGAHKDSGAHERKIKIKDKDLGVTDIQVHHKMYSYCIRIMY